MSNPEIFDAILRTDLSAFVEKCFAEIEQGKPYAHNWHVDAIAYQLTRIHAGETRRLIVNIPPRHLKSLTVTIAFTAWSLGHDPTKKIICVSHSKDLAREHANSFLRIVESPWYQRLFPSLQVARRGHRITELKTTRGGFRLATSIEGAVLGRGADLIVIDDPIQPLAALSVAERAKVKTFYDQTLYTRLNDKEIGAIILVMQRLHEDDLVAHVEAIDDWEKLQIAAIAPQPETYALSAHPGDQYHRAADELLHPAREGREILDQVRRTMGSRGFRAQYQQAPVPLDGNIIKRNWIRYYDEEPEEFDLVVASWDTASTTGDSSDYSVGTLWGLAGNSYYLLNVIRGQFEFSALRREVLAMQERNPDAVTLVEETDTGRALAQDLRSTRDLRPILDLPRFDKRARLEAQSARFEAGDVLLPRAAAWLDTYLAELLAFPSGRHDDQVDSTSQALRYLTRKRGQLALTEPPPRQRPTGTRRRQGFVRA
ncbi:MAG: phage terminase large subunit [Rhodospirillales bacterium]|jgi:predicted phage terminase large subunit-like protein